MDAASGFGVVLAAFQRPRRMWKRYLVRGPKIFLLLGRIELRVRQSALLPGVSREAPIAANSPAPVAISTAASPGQSV